MLTHKDLICQLDYDHLTGIFTWKVNKGTASTGDIAGTLNGSGYIQISIDNKLYSGQRLAWFYVHGYMPEGIVDHKDRIKHHNWIDNLRETSHQCNIRNSGNRNDNTSGVKGVYIHTQTGKWTVSMQVGKKRTSIGLHVDFDEAVCHRLAAEQCVNWSGCDSHSPAYLYVKENIQKRKCMLDTFDNHPELDDRKKDYKPDGWSYDMMKEKIEKLKQTVGEKEHSYTDDLLNSMKYSVEGLLNKKKRYEKINQNTKI